MFFEFIGTSGKCVNRQCGGGGGGGGELNEDETLLVLDYNLFNDYDEYSYVKIQKDLKIPASIYKVKDINYNDNNIVIKIEKFTAFQVKSIIEFFMED